MYIRPLSQCLDSRFLEYCTILVLDRYIFHLAVSLALAGAIMLDLDHDAAYLAGRQVECVFHDRRVFAGSCVLSLI